MTRKHFEAAARIVQRIRHNEDERMGLLAGEAQSIADSFILLFEQFSPNFDRARFLKACGL